MQLAASVRRFPTAASRAARLAVRKANLWRAKSASGPAIPTPWWMIGHHPLLAADSRILTWVKLRCLMWWQDRTYRRF